MKKLTKKQINNIAKIMLTKKGTVNQLFEHRLATFFTGGKIRTWDLGNQSRRARELDWVELCSDIVSEMGYTIKLENDAPRGGRGGEYYQMPRKISFNEQEFFKLIEAAIN